MAGRREPPSARGRPLKSRRGGLSLFIAIACLLAPAASRAEEPWPRAAARAGEEWPPPIPRNRLLLSSTFGASYNSEGFEEQVRLGAQMLLYRSDNPILHDNFVFVGVSPRINPIGARGGPSIE